MAYDISQTPGGRYKVRRRVMGAPTPSRFRQPDRYQAFRAQRQLPSPPMEIPPPGQKIRIGTPGGGTAIGRGDAIGGGTAFDSSNGSPTGIRSSTSRTLPDPGVPPTSRTLPAPGLPPTSPGGVSPATASAQQRMAQQEAWRARAAQLRTQGRAAALPATGGSLPPTSR